MADFDTKIKKVREYLLTGRSITQKEAIEMFAAYRLSSIIFKLRETLKIETRLINIGSSRFASYFIPPVFLPKE